jgi:hypothetical protein
MFHSESQKPVRQTVLAWSSRVASEIDFVPVSSTFAAKYGDILPHDSTHIISPVRRAHFRLFSLLSQRVGLFSCEEIDTSQQTTQLVFAIASRKFEVNGVESQQGFTFLFNNTIWNSLFVSP